MCHRLRLRCDKRQIHEEYLALVTAGSGSLQPTAVPWDALPAEFKESNRDQARQIGVKLRALDYGTTLKEVCSAGAVTALSDEEVEFLAKMEHHRWMAEKQRNGWTFGPVRDNEKKLHPDLVPWEALDEEAKEKDRNAVRTIPKLLDDAGFAIYPLF